MMARRWDGRKVLAVFFLSIALAMVSDGWTRQGPYYDTSLTARITRKFFRGFCNVVFGWCEVPRNIHIGWEDIEPVSGTIVGLARGADQAFIRTCWGVWEVATFPIPIPPEYRNVVEPEFVWQDLFE